MHCKRCNSTYIKLSRRNRLERAVGVLLPIHAYRCGTCFERFHGLAKPMFNLTRSLTTLLIGGFLIFSVFNNLVSKQNELPPLPPRQKTGVASHDRKQQTPPPSTQVVTLPLETNAASPTVNEPEDSQEKAGPDPALTANNEPETLPEPQREQPRETEAILPDSSPEFATTTLASMAPPVEKPEREVAKVNQSQISRRLESLHIDHAPDAVTVLLSGTNLAELFDDHQSDPGRIIIDLPGRWQVGRSIKREYPLQFASISKLRTGNHANYFRLVFDREKSGGGSYRIHQSSAGLAIVFSKN